MTPPPSQRPENRIHLKIPSDVRPRLVRAAIRLGYTRDGQPKVANLSAFALAAMEGMAREVHDHD